MNVGEFMQITSSWTLPGASNPAQNVWVFKCEVASNPVELQGAGDDIADAFVARYVLPLLPYQAPQAVLSGITIRSLNDALEGYDKFGQLAAGTNNSNMLPPFVTFNLSQVRYNYNIRNGRKGLPGPAVGTMDANGALQAGFIGAMNVVLDAWRTTDFVVETDAGNYTFVEVIARKATTPGTPPTVYSTIRDTVVKGYGSQNTRKG